MASRYGGSRYDGDRRSRSPRDRSPYGDRGSQYGDADRRRSSAESRNNTASFQANRESFRDPVTGREPPRGPKALIDPPSGPRGANDFRGGRGGRGRGRGWRDESRDRNERGRDAEYRDRPPFREERSRERDWRDRDRDSFRGRRPLSPQGRGRASPPREPFRDGPLNVDADRARRESRDGPGPLSAGSSNSDPPYGPGPAFRGGYSRGRGGRGRGDWERGRGRGFYDDQDRFGGRSRSQEGRWGRDRDERDRRERYQDSARDALRDDRDLRSRDDRDLVRPKVDRVSHEPPSTKDVSPPPIAPSAPAFGTVPVRQASSTDIQSLTGKAPPTGPRAMGEERPVSAGGSERLPPTGPSKAAMLDGSPSIPIGPRAQQQVRPPKQWMSPHIQGKKIPESPRLGRSQSFVSQQPRPFGGYRPESSHSDQATAEFDRRARRGSDAQSESNMTSADSQLRGAQMRSWNDVAVKSDRGTPSARASVDREGRPATPSDDKMDLDRELPSHEDENKDSATRRFPSPTAKPADEHRELDDEPEEGEAIESPPPPRRSITVEHEKSFVIDAPGAFLLLPDPADAPPEEAEEPAAAEDGEKEDEEKEDEDEEVWSESEEDMEDYFEEQMADAAEKLDELSRCGEGIPRPLQRRFYRLRTRASLRHAAREVSFADMIGPLPETVEFPHTAPSADGQALEQEKSVGKEEAANGDAPPAPSTDGLDGLPVPTVENSEARAGAPLEPQPKVEEMDTEGSGLPALPIAEPDKTDGGDINMEDAAEAQDTVGPLPEPASVNGVDGEKEGEFPSQLGHTTSGRTTPDAMDEDSEDKTEDDGSVYGSIEAVREFSTTPPTEDLPFFPCKPFRERKRARKALDPPAAFGPFVLGQIKSQVDATTTEQAERKLAFAKEYELYLRFTLSDDPTATKSRDFFANSSVPVGTTGKASAAPESKPEGRRGRYATELDLESVLQQSMREHEEKQEREARAQKEKHRTDKEAVIPSMFWSAEARENKLFYENAGLLPVEKLMATWQVLPPKINFTDEEAEKFEKAYLENPKQWGKIAHEVPNRDFKACIQYYYARKKELNLKEKLKKQPRRRKKGRGKQRSSALVSELGNTENEVEENPENENGERRRPRRAAAPTWGYEAKDSAVDSEGNPPSATPARRRGAAAAAATAAAAAAATGEKQDGEKTESKRGGRRARQPKADKEKAKQPVLAPQPPAGKGRSRSNSRAQGPTDWTPGTVVPAPGPELGRLPTAFEVPAIGMQPPPAVSVQPALASPERAAANSTISEVMAPPSLRPEPPPLPPSSAPTFDLGPPDRNRTPVQASSYWSVAEVNDFPGLLRAFGTDWGKIADHMQSKTPVMVKNYYIRQKDGMHKDWEAIATDADNKISIGVKLPLPPTPSAAPRKRYDAASSTAQRGTVPTQVEAPPAPGAPFKAFRVSQPSPPTLTQSTPPPIPQAAAVVPQPTTAGAPSQAMSPTNRPLRPPVAPFSVFPDREEAVPAQPIAQAVALAQKPAPVPSPVQVPPQAPAPGAIPDVVGSRSQWPMEASSQLPMLTPQKDNFRESRLSHKVREHGLRPEGQPGKPNERVPLILKQEPDIHHYEPPTYSTPVQAPPLRAPIVRNDPVPIPRQQEPHRAVGTAPAPPPPPQSGFPAGPAQALRMAFSDQRQQTPPQQFQQSSPSIDRPLSGHTRPGPTDPYAAAIAPNPPPSAPPAAPARPVEPRKSNLMALLNDDPTPAPAPTPPAPPKRLSEVSAGIKSSSTPPPVSMAARAPPPPPSAPPVQRREETPSYPYPRNPPQSSIPPLKPSYHTQSPQPPHMSAPRPQMVSPIDPGSGAQERDYYGRGPYQQHPVATSSSQQHYAPPAHAPAAQQQAPPMGYPQQQPYPSYPSSQPHSASPTPQYASHPSMSGRRDPVPVSREPWQQAQPASAPMQHQQQHPPQHQQHQQQPSWAQPKPTQQPPVQSAWAAQHGGTPKQQISAVAPPPPPAQTQHSWTPTQPQQPHPLSLRDDPHSHSRSSSLYGAHDTRSPGGMVHHQHHSSMGSRYPMDSRDPRRPEPGPPPGQPAYPRYSTPGPQGRDPGPGRSYTPVGQYDPRGPLPTQYQDPLRDAQLREIASRDPRDAAAHAQAQQQQQQQQQPPPPQHQNLLQRQLRPHDGYDRMPERRY